MSNDLSANSAQDEDEIDLRELVGVLLDHKWLIAGITGLFFVVSVAYALLAAPVYQAQAMVQVESKMPSIPGLADLSSLGMDGSSSAATTEVALITSRAVVGKAVDQLKLDTQVAPKRLPLLGDFLARRFKPETEGAVAPPLLGLNRYGWGGERLAIARLAVPEAMLGSPMTLEVGDAAGRYTLFDEEGEVLLEGQVGEEARGHQVTLLVESLAANPGTHFSVTRQRRLNVVTSLQEQVKASEQGKESGILQLSYQDEDPDLAGRFLQEVAEAYVRQNVDRNSAEASSQLSFVREQLPVVRRQVEAAQAAMNAYQTQAKSVDITMQTQGLLEQQVAVETSIQQLHMQQAEMDRSFTREHPAYRALLKQIAELESRKAGFNRQVGELPDTQQELLRLSRDLQVSNELYTALLNQAQQLDVARAGTVGNVRIIDAAAVDVTHPVKPRRSLVVLVGTLLGAFLAVGLVFLRRIMNPGMEDPSQIEELGLPVYAVIPLSPAEDLLERGKRRRRGRRSSRSTQGRLHLLAVNAPADPAVEAIRSLRTSLHFAMLEAKNNVLMISGPRPSVGKTFVSANLAAVIAQTGQKVLVIDADMRKGTLHKVLDVVPGAGLSDLLVGKADQAATIHPLEQVPNMYYMTRGEIPPNPSELLMHPRFTALLESICSQFDLVIIDTPPILAVTDAAIVGQHAGSSLLVTRFGVNQPKEVLLTKKRFEQNGVQIKGAIFNAVEKRVTGYYSYGYYEYKSGGASA
ncbi:polysaccharide biosynthesis tyrosine autokinase [Pseudoxanthomonas spadix]|uniref:polysaccharide biosynthesis tyrosine autokinase n=1 Tax=Pseudoxanthomonas spadix TaxID=415229 RepID=UPI000EFF031F|nr:polysaccharide biosynthesis tyrosine autokinase [Pseudoxanthomonas spadix]MBP3973316.1 polysaccharide biosynthesis tyrosine autokinase [Pseudoxanthomonas spadix]RMW96560.1 polysaccharide biosynthesis tyrosine autokinase [Pseudoxanthomonas spadix]